MAKIEMPSDEKAQFLLEVIEDRKAIEPKLIDLRGKTVLTDYFLVCAGFNNIHIKAIADRVLEEADERRLPTPRTEGEQVGEWVLIDFGDVVIHVMTEEARERYKLEEYWTTTQPKGALPPTPDSRMGNDEDENGVLGGEAAMFDDLDDEDEDDEDEDASFFDEADTEVEPVDEDDDLDEDDENIDGLAFLAAHGGDDEDEEDEDFDDEEFDEDEDDK